MSFQVEKIDLQELKDKYHKVLQETNEDRAREETVDLIQILLDSAKTIPVIVDKWITQTETMNLGLDGVPPAVLDYIDDQIIERGLLEEELQPAIIEMFESGSLKKIFDKNGKINQEALDTWTQQRQVELEKQKYKIAKTQSGQNTTPLPVDNDDDF